MKKTLHRAKSALSSSEVRTGDGDCGGKASAHLQLSRYEESRENDFSRYLESATKRDSNERYGESNNRKEVGVTKERSSGGQCGLPRPQSGRIAAAARVSGEFAGRRRYEQTSTLSTIEGQIEVKKGSDSFRQQQLQTTTSSRKVLQEIQDRSQNDQQYLASRVHRESTARFIGSEALQPPSIRLKVRQSSSERRIMGTGLTFSDLNEPSHEDSARDLTEDMLKISEKHKDQQHFRRELAECVSIIERGRGKIDELKQSIRTCERKLLNSEKVIAQQKLLIKQQDVIEVRAQSLTRDIARLQEEADASKTGVEVVMQQIAVHNRLAEERANCQARIVASFAENDFKLTTSSKEGLVRHFEPRFVQFLENLWRERSEKQLMMGVIWREISVVNEIICSPCEREDVVSQLRWKTQLTDFAKEQLSRLMETLPQEQGSHHLREVRQIIALQRELASIEMVAEEARQSNSQVRQQQQQLSEEVKKICSCSDNQLNSERTLLSVKKKPLRNKAQQQQQQQYSATKYNPQINNNSPLIDTEEFLQIIFMQASSLDNLAALR